MRKNRKRPFGSGPAMALLLAASLCVSCGDRLDSPPQNVLLITLDTQRADFVGAYGENKALTPQIDSFAAQGILYSNAFSPIPITLPAHASLFYSLPPHRLRSYNNGQVFLPDSAWTSLAEAFQRHGAKTAAFVSLGVLNSRFNLSNGFDLYWDEAHPRRWYRTAREVNDHVLPWLQQNRQDRFFLWVHFSDPHDPYAPPTLSPDLRIRNGRGEVLYEICAQWREDLELGFDLEPGTNRIQFESLKPFPVERDEYRVSLNDILFQDSTGLEIEIEEGTLLERGDSRILAFRDQAVLSIQNPGPARRLIITAQGNLNLFPSEHVSGYRSEVEYLDSEIGRLKDMLISLGLMENTLIILVGDHGEGLGEHTGENREAYFGHVHYLRNTYLRIPLILLDPRSGVEPARVHSLVSLLDIAPTLMEKMGWTPLPFHTGQVLPQYDRPDSRFLFQETYRPEAAEDRFGGIKAPWHLIFTPSRQEIQLYRIEKDRAETQNVYAMFQEDEKVRELYSDVIRKAQEIGKSKGEVKLDPESLEMLRSLGYIK